MFEPIGNRVVVELQEQDSMTASGIVLPDTAKEKPQQGVVKALGEGISFINVGDTILFAKYGGTEVTIDGQELVILREMDVLGRIK